jgi:hypothetical protein
MRKKILLLTVLVLGFLISSFAGVQTAKASVWVMVDQLGQRVTGVNQPVEFTASGSGGAPPYTFQWFTTFLDPNVPPEHWTRVAVPGATSSTFKFVESIPGRYGISIRISDSKGEGEYQSFQPIGIVVTVQLEPVAQPTPLPSHTPSPTPAPPSISWISQQNKTYTENYVPLNFSLSQPTQWTAYSLDGQANVTLDGNTTLTGLPNGQHTVIIYANDTYGNTAIPQTITFNMKVPAPFPTIEVTATLIVIVRIVAAIFLITKHTTRSKMKYSQKIR